MSRALVYASVASMIQQFNMENIRLLQEAGYQVDVACNLEQGSTITPETIAAMKAELEGKGVRVIHIPVPRKITAVGEILRSFRMTRKLMKERCYSLIHCHSPIGGVLCRLANRFSGRYGKASMIYTAHGFHFFKGAPLVNWLTFYPLEWLCSRYTDVLITINREDYALAQKKMGARQVIYVPGIGVDLEKFRFSDSGREELRRELGIDPECQVLLNVGELNAGKNQELVIRALALLQPEKVQFLICGLGALREPLQELICQLGLQEQVRLLGYRNDIPRILQAADIFVFPSVREGLSVALMESMAAGKAVACSRIRGNTDLIDDEGGVLFDPMSVDDCADAIGRLLDSDYVRMGRYNAQKIAGFSRETVNRHMAALYKNC